MQKSPEAVSVVVRVRPWNEREKAAGTVPIVHTDNQTKTVTIVRRSDKKQTRFSGFKAVLTQFTSQAEVFDTAVRPLVDEVSKACLVPAVARSQSVNQPPAP